MQDRSNKVLRLKSLAFLLLLFLWGSLAQAQVDPYLALRIRTQKVVQSTENLPEKERLEAILEVYASTERFPDQMARKNVVFDVLFQEILKKRNNVTWLFRQIREFEKWEYEHANKYGFTYVKYQTGQLFYTISDFIEAEKYFEWVVEKGVIDSTVMRGAFINSFTSLGVLNKKKNELKKAGYYHRKALQYANLFNDTAWIGLASGNLAGVVIELGDTTSAIQLYKRDLELSTIKNLPASIFNGCTDLAKIYIRMGQFDLADKYIQRGIDLVESKKQLLDRQLKGARNLYRLKATVLYYKANYKEAIRMSMVAERYDTKLDSIERVNQGARELADMEKLRYHDEVVSLNLQIDNLKRKRVEYIFLVISILIVLGIIVIYYLRLQNANKRILQQKEELNDINKLKDRLFSIISHDMRSPFVTMEGLLHLMEDDNLTDSERTELLKNVRNHLATSIFTLENLLSWSMIQISGSKQFYPVTIPVKKLVDEVCLLYIVNANNKKLIIKNECTDSDVVFADRDQIRLVLRNLISNAIKFSRAMGTVTIRSDRPQGGNLCIHVLDEGVGIREEVARTIFEPNTFYTSYGTQGEKGTGLGLQLCREYIVINNGKIRVDSREGYGSDFNFTLPISPN